MQGCGLKYDPDKLETIIKLVSAEELDYYRIVYEVETLYAPVEAKVFFMHTDPLTYANTAVFKLV